MATKKYRHVTFMYVSPVEMAEMAAADLRDLCTLNDSLQELAPSVSLTSIPGQLRIELVFSASSPQRADEIGKSAIAQLVIGDQIHDDNDHYMRRRGSNTLSFA